MKSVLLITILCTWVLHSLAQQPKASDLPRPSLEGSVVNAQGGEPIRKASVQAISEERTQGEAAVYSAITDSEGHFKIDSLDPGRYRVFVERSGFIGVDQHHRRSEGVELSVEAGKPIKDFVVRAIPAAAITGRVLDEEGDPVPNVAISVLRRGYLSCRDQLDVDRSERTNDLGEYRVGGLMPGKYFVSAAPLAGYTSIGSADKPALAGKPQMAYVTTYYPGTVDIAQAAPVELHPGETMPADFALSRTPSFRVRGTVVNIAALGETTSGAKGVVLLRPRPPEVTVREGEIDRAGNFEIEEVPPGLYMVSTLTANGSVSSATQTIEVTNSDINNLRLTADAGGAIRGQLRVEGNPNLNVAGLHVYIRAVGEETYLGALGSDSTQVKRDGSFELAHVPPGTYELVVAGTSTASQSLFVKRVRIGGRNVPETGLQLANGPVAVEVIASSAASQIEGSVIDRDQPAPNATVVALPRPSRRGTLEHYATALSDQHGRFHIAGLRPGDYTLLAWENVESGAWCDPEFLKNYEPSGQAVHVGEGERQAVTLQLIPANDDGK